MGGRWGLGTERGSLAVVCQALEISSWGPQDERSVNGSHGTARRSRCAHVEDALAHQCHAQRLPPAHVRPGSAAVQRRKGKAGCRGGGAFNGAPGSSPRGRRTATAAQQRQQSQAVRA